MLLSQPPRISASTLATFQGISEMEDQAAFAQQDAMDYSAWRDFIHEDIDVISMPVLIQMVTDLQDELKDRENADS